MHVLVDLEQPVLSKATQKKLGMIANNYPHSRVWQVKADSASNPTKEQKMKDLAEIIAESPQVFDGVCRIMKGDSVHLTLREGSVLKQTYGYKQFSAPLLIPFEEKLNLQKTQ